MKMHSQRFWADLSRNALVKRAAFVILLLFGNATFAGDRQRKERDMESIRADGKAIVRSAAGILSSNLIAASKNEGFTNALEFCSIHAIPLTQAVSTNERVFLRRVAIRTRNPENKPDGTESQVLAGFAEQLKRGEPPSPVVQTDRYQDRYFEPIIINNPLCLNCHGTPGGQIKPETLAIIRKLYPDDTATGFAMGDLRGMWSVIFPRPALPSKVKKP